MTGRDDNGRYIKGHKSNGGRKPRQVEQSYLDAMMGVVSLMDWRQIVAKARDQALKGDPVARKWLGDYLQGTPVNRTELTGDGGDALTIIVEHVRQTDQTT